jgi:short-subunit dehydrogenase
MRTLQLQGKAVVITGAASGIGRALAQALGQQGARLLLADIDVAGLQAIGDELRSKGVQCRILPTDSGSEAALYALAAHAMECLGGADIVINNAGVSVVAPVENLPTPDAHWLMNIIFWGVVHGCHAFLPQLRQRPDALLVNISSIFAMVSMPTQSMYNASKAAVRGFSDALREELRGSSVGVLCVHPGGIKTNIANSARMIDLAQVADTAQEFKDNFQQVARTTPAQAAAVILRAIEQRKTRVLIGADAKLLDLLYRLFPTRVTPWMNALGQRLRTAAEAKRKANTAHKSP